MTKRRRDRGPKDPAAGKFGDRHPPPLRPYSDEHDGSEIGEFQTYVKRRRAKKRKAKR